MRRLRTHLTYANVIATLALVIAVGGGAAYAANTVFSADIVDGEVKAADIGANAVYSAEITDGQVKGADLGANAVTSGKIADGQVLSSDVKDFSLGNGDFLTGSVDSRVATDNSLTSADVKNFSLGNGDFLDGSVDGRVVQDQSGVDTCTHGTVRFHELCVGVANAKLTWGESLRLCADLELRLPSVSEAVALARAHNLPNVDSESFWTDDSVSYTPPGIPVEVEHHVYAVRDDAGQFSADGSLSHHDAGTLSETVCVTTPTN